jgi:hypothetical protein
VVINHMVSFDNLDVKMFHGFCVCAIDGAVRRSGLCMQVMPKIILGW